MRRGLPLLILSTLMVLNTPCFAGSRGRPQRAKKALNAVGRAVRSPAIKGVRFGVRITGGLADRIGGRMSKRGNPRTVRKLGLGLRYFLGTQTLKHTSIEAGIGVAVTHPKLVAFANYGVSTSMWSGSVAYWEASDNRATDVHWNINHGIRTFVGGRGYSRLQGHWRSIKLPWLSYSVAQRGYSAGMGLANILSVNTGEVYAEKEGQWDRGPFINAGMTLPLGLIRVGGGARVFYPPFIHIARLFRPLAETAEPIQTHLTYYLKKGFAWALSRQAPERPDAEALKKFRVVKWWRERKQRSSNQK